MVAKFLHADNDADNDDCDQTARKHISEGMFSQD